MRVEKTALTLEEIFKVIESCNVSFLVGSGLSCPYIKLMGSVEALLTELDKRNEIKNDTKMLIRASIYKKYFDDVIVGNLGIISGQSGMKTVLSQYEVLLKNVNDLILRRKMSILSKEVNLFTTNIDIFLELALDEMQYEYNDGFSGRFTPVFNSSNFKKTRSKHSLHYDNIAELSVFNLLKLHGSCSWHLLDNRIVFSHTLSHLQHINDVNVARANFVEVRDNSTVDTLLRAVGKTKCNKATKLFMEAYEASLTIVNPTKEKFKSTLMNATYYELLRMYSNELERENTVMFVMGFSFADEHILELTARAANSNPTLLIYVIAHSTKAGEQISERFDQQNIVNNNVKLITPAQISDPDSGNMIDEYQYDLTTINNKIFSKLLQMTGWENGRSSSPSTGDVLL